MDEIDRSAAAEALFRQSALTKAQTRPHEAQEIDAQGRVVCLDCGEPIPAARLRALPHAVRCVDCQAEYEEG